MSMTTIVALATPPGVSALAVVRISGLAAQDICKAILPSFDMKPRVASLTKAVAFKHEANMGHEIDKLIAIYFPAPNSHTGEDVLELFPHGNPFIIRKLLESICKVPNVRLAELGEFTELAFLNGKIDLTQAEALGDLLSASNSKTLANAQRLLTGEVSAEIKALAEKIKEISASMELEVDFAEDIGTSPLQEGCPKGGVSLHNVLNNLQGLKKRFKKNSNELPRVVFFGAPNAGKSTLINALVSEDRLLVSEVPGTTRDFVEVPLHLPGGDILLTDTAGLASEAQSDIDRQAMQKTYEVLEKANLKILVADISVDLPAEFEEWKKIADLTMETHLDLQNRPAPSPAQLIQTLNDIFFPKEESEETWITSERQIACIKKAEECVKRALESNAIETAAFEMREARNALCSITGEISDENILDEIFSNYCIGK